MRVQIHNNKIYYSCYDGWINAMKKSKSPALLTALLSMTYNYDLPDVDFIFTGKSSIWERPNDGLKKYKFVTDTPIFMMAKDLESKYMKNGLLLPDAYMLSRRMEWRSLKHDLGEERKTAIFSEKIPKYFFRGTNYDEMQGKRFRSKLIHMSLKFPNMVDAKFTRNRTYRDVDELNFMKFDKLGLASERIKEIEHVPYKY